MHGKSRRQSLRRLSRTQITKVGDMICVADFYDLCPRLFPAESFGESHKIGVLKFGLNSVKSILVGSRNRQNSNQSQKYNQKQFCLFVKDHKFGQK